MTKKVEMLDADVLFYAISKRGLLIYYSMISLIQHTFLLHWGKFKLRVFLKQPLYLVEIMITCIQHISPSTLYIEESLFSWEWGVGVEVHIFGCFKSFWAVYMVLDSVDYYCYICIFLCQVTVLSNSSSKYPHFCGNN